MIFSAQTVPPQGIEEIPYSTFKRKVVDGEVSQVTIRGDEAVATLRRTGSAGDAEERVATRLPPIGDPALLPALEQHGVEITNLPAEDDGTAGLFRGLLPWLILIGVYWWMWNRFFRNVTGRFGGRDASDFLTGSARKEEKIGQRVTFDDVAGQDNAKREVAELVAFLRDPARYSRLGAEAPRGVLLVGPPGTGKTLLARALAGEAGVPFFHISASEFIEMFVGVGASRVRKMFDEAKRRAPAIIFIDELDSVGRVRGAGLGGGHDEREQTLNQILAEMDGFSGHEAVIVLAATNRPDVLDPALLRPGRFDRHVTLELPDRKGREAVLKVHSRRVPLAADVDLGLVAAGTPGFSGADLKNVVNEAAMAAAREGAEAVTMRHFDEMRDKVMMGSVRTLAIQPEERHRLAIHEAGHTLVAHHVPDADPIYKVTIIPRGRSLGGTHQLPEEERHTLPESYLKARLAVMLGGRTAEKELLGTVSSGADEDIRQATQLARAMVARWGMADEIGPVDLRQSDEHPFLGREFAQPRRFSETTAHEVDQATARMLREAEDVATAIVAGHRQQIQALVAALKEHETLDRDAIAKCLGKPRARRRSGKEAAA
ncbi:MAG: ATP-dependent zinc metalloprotease FtsH [Inquilinus sp.]|nr:ATP-dependent zinc metalloprotease FtsH [Inquilinus sp.]